MTTEGNTWQKVWEQAQAVPISRQKRLFDDTNEALKVLHYLETRKMHEIYNLTIVPLLHSAILKLIVSIILILMKTFAYKIYLSGHSKQCQSGGFI